MSRSIANALVSGPVPGTDGADVFEYRFRGDDATFAGHFPGRPVLPGVFQIEIVRRAASAVAGREMYVREVMKARFRRPILPAETLTLHLRLRSDEETTTANGRFMIGDRTAGEALLLLCEQD